MAISPSINSGRQFAKDPPTIAAAPWKEQPAGVAAELWAHSAAGRGQSGENTPALRSESLKKFKRRL